LGGKRRRAGKSHNDRKGERNVEAGRSCLRYGIVGRSEQRRNQRSIAYDKVRRPDRTGELNASAKLTAEKALEIFNSTLPQVVLAAKFGVSQGTVSGIKTKKKWRHLHRANEGEEDCHDGHRRA
jgi:hypothetical protein